MTSLNRIVGAHLADGRIVDIYIDFGHIAKIADHQPNNSLSTGDLDAGGQLIVGSFCEPHAHLDKAFLSERIPNPRGDLVGAIEAVHAARHTLTFDDTVERASRAVKTMVANGVTRIRSHADTFNGSTMQVRALRQVALDHAHLCELQVCALVQWPLTGTAGAANRRLAEQARLDGADLIGGCPHLDSDPSEANEVFLMLARDFDCGLDLHVDETLDPTMLSLDDLARRVLGDPLPNGVTASHCVSLGMQDIAIQKRVASLVSRADINVITLPQTNLYLQGRSHQSAMPRGLTALQSLRDAGVRLAAGADNLQDPFNPIGRADPLETAALLVSAGHFSPEDALAAVSFIAHDVTAGRSHKLAVGNSADFVITPAQSIRELIAFATHERVVIYRGRIVSKN